MDGRIERICSSMKDTDRWEIEELAHRAMGKTDTQADQAISDGVDIDEELGNKYGVDFEQYCKIVNDLLPFTPLIQTAITGGLYHAFVDAEQTRSIIRRKVED